MAARGGESSRPAADGDTVLVHYKGTFEDGTVFDSSDGKDPLTFVLGKRQVVPGFEAAVRGLSPGEKKSVTLPPDQAYGERDERLVLSFPAEKVPEGLQVGMQVNLGSGGRQVPARVTKINPDGSAELDCNNEMAGKTLLFDVELVGFKELVAPATAPTGKALGTFAAGCFWGVELAFQRVPGVESTSVGYAQGQLEKPTYEDICSGTSGHTEAVRVVYDPNEVTFEQLLTTFWERVGKNATTLNLAGNDSGPQYRSGIYFHSEEQKAIAEKSVAELQERLGEKVVTEVEAAAPFWFAEDYHQQYLSKGGRFGRPQSAEKGCTDTIACYG